MLTDPLPRHTRIDHAPADQREFIVSPRSWQRFLEALDRPARVNRKLAQLFKPLGRPTRRRFLK
jgi:uncharacterized protein (DUF1778 family)